MSYSFHVIRTYFSPNAIEIIKRAQKSLYLQEPYIQIIDQNAFAEFLGKDGKLIRMVIKPDGSYNLTSYAPERIHNASCSEMIKTKDGFEMKDVLKSVEKKVADKKSKFDVLDFRDYTQENSRLKRYIKKNGEKLWIAVKKVIV